MRIAVSGAHHTGKTTLVVALSAALPSHDAVEEPYVLLEDEGHVFADPPTFDDFEAQLARAAELAMEVAGDAVFDRCPVDLLAYLAVHEEASRLDLERWRPSVRDALETLDLIVYVPVEVPDRIETTEARSDALRSRVDGELREMLLDDSWGLRVPAVEVSGTVDERVRQVLARLG